MQHFLLGLLSFVWSPAGASLQLHPDRPLPSILCPSVKPLKGGDLQTRAAEAQRLYLKISKAKFFPQYCTLQSYVASLLTSK